MSVYGVKPSPLGLAIAAGACLLLFFWFTATPARLEVPQNKVSMQELLSIAIQACENGGDRVKAIADGKDIGQSSKGQTAEGVDDPLTLGDQYSHEAIVGTIRKAYGDSMFIFSEEKDSHHLDLDSIKEPSYKLSSKQSAQINHYDELIDKDDVTIWVDPLDATKEYTEKLYNYVTTMVCVAVKGEPVIGVIHKPFKNDATRTVWAWSGHGSNIVDKSEEHSGNDGIIIVSRSHKGDVEDVIKKYVPGGHAIGAGGAGYKVEELFGYPSDNDEKTTPIAYVHTTLIKKWDICSGNAVLNHFGGKMTKLSGDNINYHKDLDPKNTGGLVASLHKHDQVLQWFKEYDHGN
jgi:inositol monophosphatase 3